MQFGFSSSEIKIKELVQEYMTKIKLRLLLKMACLEKMVQGIYEKTFGF